MRPPDVDETLIADVFARDCASRDLLADVVGKWPVLALLALDEGGYRFNALRRRVQGVSEKMLAQTLQTLERDGLVEREVVSAIPPRVEYALTPVGERVAQRVQGLVEMLEDAVPYVVAAREAYDARRVWTRRSEPGQTAGVRRPDTASTPAGPPPDP